MWILLALLLAGCGNKRGPEWKELAVENEISVRRMYKVRRADILSNPRALSVHATHTIPSHNFGRIRDIQPFGKHILVLLDKSHVRIDTDNWRITQIDLDASKLERIITLADSYVLVGKSNLLHIKDKKRNSLEVKGVISNVLEYNDLIIVVLTDGRSSAYKKSDLSSFWTCQAPDDAKMSVQGSVIVIDKLFMVINGQIAFIDLDNGTITDYVNITKGEPERSSIIHLGDKVVANANDVLLEMNIDPDYACTKYRIKDLQSIKRDGDFILLQTKHETLVTNYELLLRGNYLYSISGNNYDIKSNNDNIYVLTALKRLKGYDKYGRNILDVPADKFVVHNDRLISLKNHDIVVYR